MSSPPSDDEPKQSVPSSTLDIIIGRSSGLTVEDFLQILQMTCRTYPAITKMKLTLPVINVDTIRSCVNQIRIDQGNSLIHLDTV